MIVEIKIMPHTKPHTKHLLRFQKMTDICPAVMTAGRALALLINRFGIQLILCIKKIHLAMVGIHVTMTALTTGIYTDKKVKTKLTPQKEISHNTKTKKHCFGCDTVI